MSDPVVIGGTGGSGTRCLAAILMEAGCYLGWNLNKSHDSLSLTPFLRRYMVEAYNHFESLSPEQVAQWEVDFSPAASTHLLEHRGQPIWGWKNPTSMYLIPFFSEMFPRLKFIHLVRDGRDMALSTNSNQYIAINPGDRKNDIVKKAEFWSTSNTRVHQFAKSHLHENYIVVRLEELCNDPTTQVERILGFIGSSAAVDSCMREVSRPTSVGRYQALPQRKIQDLTEAAKSGLLEFGYI